MTFSDKLGYTVLDWFLIFCTRFLIGLYTHDICETFPVPYRKQLSNQHIGGFFWDVAHKNCCRRATAFTFFGSNKIFIMDRGLTDHWHRRHHYWRGRGHDAHVNWDHWSTCKTMVNQYCIDILFNAIQQGQYLKQSLPDGKPAYWGGIPGGGNNGRFRCGGNDIMHLSQTWKKKNNEQEL